MKRARSRKALWENTPAFVKAGLRPLLAMTPPRFLLGKRYRAGERFVETAQWWSAEQAREYQFAEVRKICAWAYNRSEYYRRVYKEVGFEPGCLTSVDDLSFLPTINRQTIAQHLEEMCAISPASKGVDYVSTGGTSGTPLQFYIGAERSAVEYAYLVSSWRRCGYELGIPVAVIRGRIVPPDRTGLRHEYDPALRHHHYSNFHMTDENMRRYWAHIRGLGRCYLHAYPSSVSALARFIQGEGIEVPMNVRGIIVESETVYPDQRHMVEKLFGRRYFSCYGHSEKLVLAAECEHSEDYHIWPTYGFFELLDGAGNRVVTPGRRGEIVGTGFINKVVPFIRYRTGDVAAYVGDHCDACGRKHTIIRNVEGRWPSGALVARDGSHISMTALNVHDDTFSKVRRYQFYQDTPGAAAVRVVASAGFTEEDEARIIKTLDQRVEGRIRFSVVRTDKIASSPRGKAIWVEQLIPGARDPDLFGHD